MSVLLISIRLFWVIGAVKVGFRNGDSSRTINLGDREEQQLFLGETVR